MVVFIKIVSRFLSQEKIEKQKLIYDIKESYDRDIFHSVYTQRLEIFQNLYSTRYRLLLYKQYMENKFVL